MQWAKIGVLSLGLGTSAHAIDVEIGADADVALAFGQSLKGPGGGADVRLGIGPDPLKLGPTALALSAEVRGAYWEFPMEDATLLRTTVGARGILRLMWLRLPGGDGGRGRGIRLDMPLAVHAGLASLDNFQTYRPTVDAQVGVAIGFLPVEVGLHIGGGVMSADQELEPTGAGWVQAGVDVGVIF